MDAERATITPTKNAKSLSDLADSQQLSSSDGFLQRSIRSGRQNLQRLQLGEAWFTLLALATIPLLSPSAKWISILRGEDLLETEIRQAQAHGYYEAILTESDHKPSRHARRETQAKAHAQAPKGWRPFAESGIVQPVDGYLRWRMKPNLRTRWNGASFSTNRLGYRTPDVEIPKPSDVYRIVVLGSSNTMGHGVNDDEMFVRLLENWLNESAPGEENRRVEVVNLAVSSDSPSQNIVRLQADVPSLEPDWILNDVTVLDYSLEELHLHSIVRNRKAIPFAYIRSILMNADVSPSDSAAEFNEKLRGTTEDLLDGAYQGWAAEAQAIGAPLTLIQLPRTDAEIENRNLKQMTRKLAGKYSLPMIDLSGVYRGRDISEYRLSPWDKHPSPLGHRLIFEGLRDALIHQGGGPGLPLGTEEAGRGKRKTTDSPSVSPA